MTIIVTPIAFIAIALVCFGVSDAFTTGTAPEGSLLAVTLVARHGDRSPTRIPAKWLPYWTQLGVAAGELTQVGRSQHNALGKLLRQKYITDEKLLSDKFVNSEMYIRSTDFDRCLASAASMFGGIYPDAIPPIHTVPSAVDTLLQPTGKCPSYIAGGDVVATRLGGEFKSQHADIIQSLKDLTGFVKYADADLLEYCNDNWICQSSHNDTMPIDPYLQSVSGLIWNFTQNYIYESYAMTGGDTDVRGAAGAELARYIAAQFAIASPKKFTLFLAHDSTLMALLAALKQLPNGAQSAWSPPYYASSIIFELRKRTDGSLVVYANWGRPWAIEGQDRQTPAGWQYIQEPVSLPCNGQSPCTLATWTSWVNKFNPDFQNGCCVQTADFARLGCNAYDKPYNDFTSEQGPCQYYRRLCPSTSCGVNSTVRASDYGCQSTSSNVSPTPATPESAAWKNVAIGTSVACSLLTLVAIYLCCTRPKKDEITNAYTRA